VRTSSSVPWMASTGQRTWAHSGSTEVQIAPSQPSRPDVAAASTSGSTSSAQPIPSSICLVECGSVNIEAMKNRTKSS
jgi:hypothetical protein